MTRGRSLVLPRLFTLAAVTLLVGTLLPVNGLAGYQHGKKSKKTKESEVQTNDEEYGAKIKQYTTEPYFSTELVDHLPASATVPTPEKVLGYVIGTPNKLTYSKDMYNYYRELEKASPRVRVFTAPERTEEGKEQLLVVVSDADNLAKLDHYKEITAKLADPRHLTESDAKALIDEGKTFYWASGSIHSPETGSPEMLMELAYRLAVDESPFYQTIRKNTIVMITPTLEVDGRDFAVDQYNYRKANPGKAVPPLLYWGKYVQHDNNRDGLGMALALSRNQMKTFLEYHPQVLHDLHESVPFIYISTGTGPYNPWLDPIVVDEWHIMAYHEIDELTKRNVRGVWSHGFYDGWAANYMFYVANGHNSIGRFYETFGGLGADTGVRTVPKSESERDWFRPNPPMEKVNWSIRNNINLQESAILFGINFVSSNKEKFLNNFYLKSKRSVEKATTEGPAAYVIPGDTKRPTEAADMVNLLREFGVEVNTATQPFSVKDHKFPAGSYVIRMDQPYSRMADMLLDKDYYNVNDPRPYDDTGWTLGALRNVETVRVTDASVLNAPMVMLTSDASVKGKIVGSSSPVAYVINNNTENNLATFRFAMKDLKIEAAEDHFKADGTEFNAGSFIIKTSGNPGDLREKLEPSISSLGLTAYALDKLPEVKTHDLALPRIAILHTWTSTQNEGWYRIEFDRLHIPYSYISVHEVRDTADLRSKYDVIIFPPAGGSAQSLVNGIPVRGEPIPFQKSDLTPNFGLAPDQSADIRGGLELEGVAHLQKFVQQGGLFITVTNTASLPIEYGMTSDVAIQPSARLQARGSVYNAQFTDHGSPISYGYGEGLDIYFNQAPLFRVTDVAAQFRDSGGASPRPSGRGTLTDPDIVQGRKYTEPEKPKKADDDEIDPEVRVFMGPMITPPEMRPRVILSFNKDEKNLLISGELANGSELAGKPAVVDVPLGKGHIVMFANNPMWRHETQGSFFLVFNAAMNYDHLGIGRKAKADKENEEKAKEKPASSVYDAAGENCDLMNNN